MSSSARAFIWYGMNIAEEDRQFPWTNEKYEWDADAWWRDIKGYKPPFELYREDGNYIGGEHPGPEVVQKWYEARRSWEEANPIPINIINVGSCDFPLYCLAVRRTTKRGSGYEATPFDPATLVVPPDDLQKFNEFIMTYCADLAGEPLGWHFSSYYG